MVLSSLAGGHPLVFSHRTVARETRQWLPVLLKQPETGDLNSASFMTGQSEAALSLFMKPPGLIFKAEGDDYEGTVVRLSSAGPPPLSVLSQLCSMYMWGKGRVFISIYSHGAQPTHLI